MEAGPELTVEFSLLTTPGLLEATEAGKDVFSEVRPGLDGSPPSGLLNRDGYK